MSAPDRFIAWCKQEQASIEQELDLMLSCKVRKRAKARLAELNELLTEAGSSTVVKPDNL